MRELEAGLRKLKQNKTGGPDDSKISFLKELSPMAEERLLVLYNLSFQEGTAPDSWWVAEMLPTDKPGKPHEFRPISLTSIFARGMGK